MSHKDKLFALSRQEGFRVRKESDRIILEAVPCLLENKEVCECTIEKSFDGADEAPTETIGGAAHSVRISVSSGKNPFVYQANGHPIGNRISVAPDGASWADISVRLGGPAMPEDDPTVWHLVYRYAKQIIGAVKEHEWQEDRPSVAGGVFKIPNTFEGRAGVQTMQERINNQSIALIGLGGTGSYVLDLLVKTPVATIHLCDDDEMDWHNFMRAPGVPDQDEIDFQKNGKPKKVNYYHKKYDPFRHGICPHTIRVGDAAAFTAFLSENPIDFAFVSIDQRREDGDAPRQDEVYAVLTQAGVPFIDSGISLTLVEDQIQGAVTTSSYASGSSEWEQAIPNARVTGNHPGYRNIQLPEANALAASLAVMEWRRLTNQYARKTDSFLHKFRLEKANIVWGQKSHDKL